MRYKIHPKFKNDITILNSNILNFKTSGKNYGNQNRNSLKLFKIDNLIINVKSFKPPIIINKIAYRFFRKSKAQRSYEYACKLQNLHIGTPQPIAFYEIYSSFLFTKSYYVSEHLNYDLTYRELTTNSKYPNHENILRAFTRFTFELHQKGIHFLDHSPGNTLIKKNTENNYDFYLVDLNRMKFKDLNFKTRMKNFARLTKEKYIIRIMANEYAKLINEDESIVFNTMWFYTTKFRKKLLQKKNLKKKLKSLNI